MVDQQSRGADLAESRQNPRARLGNCPAPDATRPDSAFSAGHVLLACPHSQAEQLACTTRWSAATCRAPGTPMRVAA